MKFKKQSNKKRKLEYIRTKNRLRKGGFIIDSVKCHESNLEFTLDYVIPPIVLRYSRIYKLNLEIFKFQTSIEGFDFVIDIITVKFYMKLKQ